jgi:hypothetical protein
MGTACNAICDVAVVWTIITAVDGADVIALYPYMSWRKLGGDGPAPAYGP